VLSGTVSSFQNYTTVPPYFVFLWPPFAFYRCLSVMAVACGVLKCLSNFNDMWDIAGGQILVLTIMLFLEAIFLLLLAVYLEQVIPKQYGVPKHPLFPLKYLWGLFKKKKPSIVADIENAEKVSLIKKNNYELLHQEEGEEITKDEELEDDEDLDVRNERLKVETRNYDKNSPIIIENLHKKYSGYDKIAIKNLTLSITKGECFGLLGPNGAGKKNYYYFNTNWTFPSNLWYGDGWWF